MILNIIIFIDTLIAVKCIELFTLGGCKYWKICDVVELGIFFGFE